MDTLRAQLAATLRARGMQLSRPRLLLLAALSQEGTHLTAEELYTRLRAQAPGISRTTVYNVLRAFEQRGLARQVRIRPDQAQYELARADHAHFRCNRCGGVEDVPLDISRLQAMCPGGWEALRTEVHFHGICRACHNEVFGEEKLI